MGKKSKYIVVLTTMMFLFNGCTDGFKAAITGNSGGDAFTLDNASVAFTSPAENANFGNELNIEVRCTPALPLIIATDSYTDSSICPATGTYQTLLRLTGSEGPVTVQLTQMNEGQEVTAERVFNRDTTPPLLQISTPAGGSAHNNAIDITGQCESDYQIAIYGEGVANDSFANCVDGAFQTSVSLSDQDGAKTIYVAQTDEVENQSILTLNVIRDTQAPQIQISSPAQGSQFTGLFSASGNCEAGMSMQISGSVPLDQTINCQNGQFNISIVPSQGDGNKAIVFSQTDLAGNQGQATLNVEITNSQDSLTLISPQPNDRFQNTVTLQGACFSGFNVDISGNIAQNQQILCANSMFSMAVALSSGDGAKSIIVQQNSATIGNHSQTVSVIRDTTPPNLTVGNSQLTVNQPRVNLLGQCESGQPVRFQGSGIAQNGSTPCQNDQFTTTVDFTSGDGTKNIVITQADSVGNSSLQNVNFTLDTTAPNIAITSPDAGTIGEAGLTVAGNCQGTSQVSFSGSGLETPFSVPCQNSQFSGDITFSAGDGTKIVEVRQLDAAGNTGFSQRDFMSLNLDGVSLYAANCAQCHGALISSAKRNRTAAQISNAIQTIGPMNQRFDGVFAFAQIQAIADALRDATPNNPACDDLNSTPDSRMRRLSVNQLENTVHDISSLVTSSGNADWMGRHIRYRGQKVPDDAGKFDRMDNDVNVYHLRGYIEIADRISQGVLDRFYRDFVEGYVNLNPGTCSLNIDSPSQVCATQFIQNLGLRAYRRPLTPTEVQNVLISFNRASGREAIANAIFHIFASPAFFLRLELGEEAAPSGTNINKLTSYEIASRLAFQFWDTIPDETLLAMAQANDLTLDTHFNAALNHVYSRQDKLNSNLRRFYSSWMGIDQQNFWHYWQGEFEGLLREMNVPKDPAIANHIYYRELSEAMEEEVLELAIYHQQNGDSFQDLFTSNISFTRDPELMAIYGVNQAAPTTISDTNAVRMPAGTRSGLLTRAVFLKEKEWYVNPILRGIKLRENFLCLKLPPPPTDIPAEELIPPEPDPTASTRQQWDQKTASPVCQQCHSQINPFGHALGKYNAFGGFADQEVVTWENQAGQMHPDVSLTVDDDVDFAPIWSGSGATSDPIQFSQMVANSSDVTSCFSQNYFRYSYGKIETDTENSCQMDRLNSALNARMPLNQVLRTIATDPLFRYRKVD